MRATDRPCVALTTAALWAIAVEALDYRRFDGVHRIAMEAMEVMEAMDPQITKGPVLRRADESCGTGSKLCPESLNGGCCQDGYSCGSDSCYATPSTCGTLTSWYPCEAVYGNGCCPDGYACETGAQCIPPSGVSYTFDCPASYKKCASSLGYGCCPSHMACASNQCYSTEAVTKTETVVVTTTEDGSRTTYRSTKTTVSTPEAPTTNVGNSDNSGEQAIFKYYPSAIAKAAATTGASGGDDSDGGGGGGGLSTGALVGIIAGSVAFLIIILVAAFIIIRHLNKVVEAVTTSKQSDGSKSRPTMKDFKPTDSEIDTFSIDPLMLPRPAAPGPQDSSQQHSPYNVGSPNLSSNDHTPNGGTTTYHAVGGSSAGHSRQTSFDAGGNGGDYFHDTGNNNRISQHSGVSAPTTNRISNDSHGAYAYTHVRNWSNASDGSDGAGGGAPTWNQLTIAELEAQSRPPPPPPFQPPVPELPMSPSSAMVARDEQRRRSSGGSSVASTARPIGSPRQRNRSESLGAQLGVVDEEMMHGFHGPADHLVGQTDSHRPGTKDSNGQK